MPKQTSLKQDMPPRGGYPKISFARVPAKSYLNGFKIIGGYIAVTAASIFLYYLNCKQVKQEEIEKRSADLCIYPLLIAERDREFLKQLRRNRDEEERLMSNVEGWEVGTWYGEPVFKTIPKDTLIIPSFNEFYAHAEHKHYAERAEIKLWT